MRSNIFFFLAVFLLATESASGQWAFELWHEGKIVLLEGDTLKGLVKYDMQQDLVQYTIKDRTADVYTARKVLFFEIFDESVRRYRHFFALPFENTSGYKAPIFFELLEEGKLTLLSRELLEYKTYSSPYYIGSASRLVLTNRYFFMKDDGSIEEFRGKRNDLIDMMGKNGKQVEKYIKTNRLKYDEKYDLAKIIGYYNSLVGS